MRPQRVATRKHAEVLQYDRFKQRSHQLVRRRSFFLQAIDVSLGEDPAFPCHFVQLDAVVALQAQRFSGNLQLGIDLVDHRARAAGALIVHRRDLFLAPAFRIVLENDDFGVLAAELNHRVNFRMHFLDCQRNGSHFLYELRAD